MADLQELVEDRASVLRRPVSIDDRHFRLLAYSPLVGENDAVAAASILHRRSPPEVAEWLKSLVLPEAEGFTRVPANEALGMVPRICAPIRWQHMLLGYVWVIDIPPLDEAAIAEVVALADEAGVILYRERLAAQATQARADELVRVLFDGVPGTCDVAAEELANLGLLEPATVVTVVVMRATHPEHECVPEAVHVELASAVAEVRRRRLTRPMIVLPRGSHVAVVCACRDRESAWESVGVLERSVREAFCANAPDWRLVVGIGGTRNRLQDAGEAYREAQTAMTLAAAVPARGPTVHWDSMGPYRSVVRLTEGAPSASVIPPPVARLLASPERDALIETAEAYLERAGNAQATAAALYLHRSSLYNRLRRVEAVAGVNLQSGDDRLELHLGLLLWRLNGAPTELPAADGAGADLRVVPADQRNEGTVVRLSQQEQGRTRRMNAARSRRRQ